MVRLYQSMPFASSCVFRECFYSTQHVSDNGGIVVASTINRGASPTGTSARITYNGTKALFGGWTKATIALRFRTGSQIGASAGTLVAKEPSALNDNCLIVQMYDAPPDHRIGINIARTAADTAQYSYNGTIALNTEYMAHFVYDGGLVGSARIALYLQGVTEPMAIVNTPPASLLWNASSLTVYNTDGGTGAAQDTSFIMREVRIHRAAFTAAECLDDYNNATYMGLP